MAEFVSVGQVADFTPGARRMVVGGRHVAVFRLGDAFHALDNLCLHRGGPLCEGAIARGVVTCPWHGWSFEIATGTNRGRTFRMKKICPLSLEARKGDDH